MGVVNGPRSPNPLVVCGTLGALVAICALVPSSPLTAALLPVVAALLAAEIDRTGRLLAVRIVAGAGRFLPTAVREDHVAEWRDHVLSVGEEGLRPVLTALFIAVRAAPALAFRLRVRLAAAKWLLEMGAVFLFGPAPLIFGDAALARRRLDRWFRFVLFCFALQALPLQALILHRRRPPIWATIGCGLALSAANVIAIPAPFGFLLLLNNGLTFWWCVEVLAEQPRAARWLTRVLGRSFTFPPPLDAEPDGQLAAEDARDSDTTQP
jgi:hypothetical protein